jgi:hypothetical protein
MPDKILCEHNFENMRRIIRPTWAFIIYCLVNAVLCLSRVRRLFEISMIYVIFSISTFTSETLNLVHTAFYAII